MSSQAIIVGIGCRQGAAAEELIGLVERVLAEADFGARDIALIATSESRVGHPAVLAVAEHFGVPLRAVAVEELAEAEVPTPSAVVTEKTGLFGIAEAAVVAMGELLVAKRKSTNATCALGRADTSRWRAA